MAPVIEGLTIAEGSTGVETDVVETAEEELARKVIARLRTGQPKAAIAAAVDLVNTIAAANGLSAFASL